MIDRLNDLWMYNLTSGLWTWLSGRNTANQAGSYGSQGVATVGNEPGSRWQHAMVLDSAGRVVYVLGGDGYAASGSGNIWLFDFFY